MESLLCSGTESNIQFAAQHLTLSPSPADQMGPGSDLATTAGDEGTDFELSYSESVKLVVAAAKEYFNSASSLMDSDMDLARYHETWVATAASSKTHFKSV